MMSTDSLKVEEQEDGTLSISWDETDPHYAFLNDMTQEEINAFFTRALEEFIKELDNEPIQ